MENQPAPTRVSKRLKLARAAREKLQPRSNETLATLPKSTFIHSIVSALPSRDERFFPVGEGTTCRGTVAKEARKGGTRRRKWRRGRRRRVEFFITPPRSKTSFL
jgi:hypothetical protein